MRRGPAVLTWLGCALCECERSGTAADETRVPEPSAAAQEYGGAAAAAPQPPAAGLRCRSPPTETPHELELHRCRRPEEEEDAQACAQTGS